jgi:hypothetical protein
VAARQGTRLSMERQQTKKSDKQTQHPPIETSL